MNSITIKSLNVGVIFYKDEDCILAYCPSLNLIGCGDTEQEAKESFDIVFEEYINYTTENNTLIEDLGKLGWEIKGSNKKLVPPDMFKSMQKDEDFRRIFNEYEFKKQNISLAIPV
jgi:predicted RNase H-like HicB family nuclease